MIHVSNTSTASLGATAPSTQTLGRYRIAASPVALPCGRFAARVSIASGHGSASSARVMRFTDDFATYNDAADFAQAQGLSWAAAHHTAAADDRPVPPQPRQPAQAVLI